MIDQIEKAVGALVLSGRSVKPVVVTLNSHFVRLSKIQEDLWDKYPLVDGNEMPPEAELLDKSIEDALHLFEMLGESIEETEYSLQTDADTPFLGEVDYPHSDYITERSRHLVATPLGHCYSVATAALNVDFTV